MPERPSLIQTPSLVLASMARNDSRKKAGKVNFIETPNIKDD